MYKDRLKLLVDRNNTTKRNLAQLLGISESCYNHYEKEKDIIPIKHLVSLSNYFDVSLDYLFSFTNEVKYKNSKPDIDKELSGLRLKNLRKEFNLTQEKLAKILKISRTTITEYERGTNIIATPFLYDICKKYNVSADYLLGKIEEPKYLK